jgi:DNA-binding winged helix-turn-helix (wHTH) protein
MRSAGSAEIAIDCTVVTFTFADYSVDTETRQLRRNGSEVHVSPKAFQLLTVLIENRSRAMTKSELHEALWPSTFVQETNLAGLVAELRQALSDSATEPRFIRTVHRFGYWFIGEVRQPPGQGAGHRSTRYWLVWETRQIALEDGDHIVGRAPDAAIWIEAAGVSRHHARIRISASGAVLEDLGSKNGTYLRGDPVTHAQPLDDGDQIRLGSVVLTFRIPRPAGSTETAFPKEDVADR